MLMAMRARMTRWLSGAAIGLGAACGGESNAPPPRSVAAPVASATADSAAPVASAPPSATTARPPKDFIQAGTGNVDPVDRGVIASADQPLLKVAGDRSRACVAAHQGRLRLRFKVTLADDGTPSAELRAAEGDLGAAEAKCILDALSRGRYTKPGTPVGPAVTKRFFEVRVETGMEPQEFQVD